MKKLLIAAMMGMSLSAHAEVESYYAHNLNDNGRIGTCITYALQGEGYSAGNCLSPLKGWKGNHTTHFVMPGEVDKQFLLFNVNPGYVIEHLDLCLTDMEFSEDMNGAGTVDAYVIFKGYEIDGVRVDREDILWNGRNQALPEEKDPCVYLELRDVNIKSTLKLFFDASHSERMTDPKTSNDYEPAGPTCQVAVSMNCYFDMPAAKYELVTKQEDVVANAHYMLTALSGDNMVGLCSHTVQSESGKNYLAGKVIEGLATDAYSYDGRVNVEFETVPDDTGFGTPGTYFLSLSKMYGNRNQLRTSSLEFYIDKRGQPYYATTDFVWDPVEMESTIIITGRTLYADLWELHINEDESVSLISHEFDNKEGRELQYNPTSNYFVYQDKGKYPDTPLYLWKKVGSSNSLEQINGETSAAIYDILGRRVENAPQSGLYLQAGKIKMVK